jgi:putative peptidoglycan lipid II flippase
MVKRFLSLLHKEYGGITEAAILLSCASLVSQLLGLIRDRALVSHLGPSVSLDMYYAAFRIPDIVYTSCALLVGSTVLLPLFAEKYNKDDTRELRRFVGALMYGFSLIMGVVCIIAFVCIGMYAQVLLPYATVAEIHTFIGLSRLLLLSPIILGFHNLFSNSIQFENKFFTVPLAPILYNLGIIFGIYVLFPSYGLFGLMYGVLLGATAELLIQIPTMIRSRMLPFMHIPTKNEWREIYRVCMLSAPRALALSLNTIGLFVLTLLLGRGIPGSISLFNFALNLQSIPLMMIGFSYAVASFPTLVRAYTESKEAFEKVIGSLFRVIVFWSQPVVGLFIVLAIPIVRVVYGTHNLTWHDTYMTALLFSILTLAIIPQSLVLIAVRAYYATKNTMQSFVINGVGLLVMILGGYCIARYANRSHEGYALAIASVYVLAQCVTYLVAHRALKHDFAIHVRRHVMRAFWHSLLGTVTLMILSYATLIACNIFFTKKIIVALF